MFFIEYILHIFRVNASWFFKVFFSVRGVEYLNFELFSLFLNLFRHSKFETNPVCIKEKCFLDRQILCSNKSCYCELRFNKLWKFKDTQYHLATYPVIIFAKFAVLWIYVFSLSLLKGWNEEENLVKIYFCLFWW